MRPVGTIAVLVGVLTWFACNPDAQGAVTVLSGGDARSCFEAARFNGSTASGVAACSNALDAGTLSPDDRAATLVNRGILRVRMADYQNAVNDYDAGLQMRPDLAEAYVDRGGAEIKMGNYKAAIVDLSKGIALGSQSPQIAYFDRGQAREHTGDYAGACSDYKQAVALQPDYVAAKNRVGICVATPAPKPD